MTVEISPRFQMKLIKEIEKTLKEEYYGNEEYYNYINKWHIEEVYSINDWSENFTIKRSSDNQFDLLRTLHSMTGELLLQIAADLEIDTPDYIPTIASFKNVIKSDYKTAYTTFNKAIKLIESDPGTSIGLANSALESIVKELLKDERFTINLNGKETLYKLAIIILKELKLLGENLPSEIKTIGNSLLTISQSVEKLRSEKTEFHGKTDGDYLIEESMFAHLVVNSVTTVGLFLLSFYKSRFPNISSSHLEEDNNVNELPF